MIEEIRAVANTVLDQIPRGNGSRDQVVKAMAKKVSDTRAQFDRFIAKFRKSKDQTDINTKGEAVKRYLKRSIDNYSKYPASLRNYQTQFEDFFVKLLNKICCE